MGSPKRKALGGPGPEPKTEPAIKAGVGVLDGEGIGGSGSSTNAMNALALVAVESEDPEAPKKRGRPKKNVKSEVEDLGAIHPQDAVAVDQGDVSVGAVEPVDESPGVDLGGVPKPDPNPHTRLRPRQGKALKAIFDCAKEGMDKQLVSLPTGVGKTVLAAHVGIRFQKVLFLVHRKELSDQAAKTFARTAPGESIGFIQQGQMDLEQRFTIGMIGTVSRRLSKIPKDLFDLVVVDEAHHAAAKTWRTVVDHFESDLRLGLSATPERHDGAPLNDMFGNISYQMSIKEAVEEDLLVRPRAMRVRTSTSIDGVSKVAGEFNEGQLAAAIDNDVRNREIVSAYLKADPSQRKALAFTAGIEHAKNLSACFNAAGVPAVWISGNDPLRDEKLADSAAGKIKVVCNAMLLTEGYDDPSIDMVLVARPMLSRVLYSQSIGRGMRLNDGKKDCIIVDFVDASKKHSAMDAWKLMGLGAGKKASKEPVDIFRPSKTAAEAVVDLWEDLYQTKLVFKEVEVVLSEFDLLAPPPKKYLDGTKPWMLEPPTENQIRVIVESGADPLEWTKGQCAEYIQGLPPTKRQALLLLALGFDVLDQTWTRGQANDALEKAKAVGRGPDWGIVNRISPEAAEELRAGKVAQNQQKATGTPQGSSPTRADGERMQAAPGTVAADGTKRYIKFLGIRFKESQINRGPLMSLACDLIYKESPGNVSGHLKLALAKAAISEAEGTLDAKGVVFRRT